MRQYTGLRVDRHVTVLVDGAPLPLGPSLAIRGHSPDGYEWGYGGSGPAQLALALLLDVSGDPDVAQRWYQDFKAQVVARMARDRWTMTEEYILKWLTATRAKADQAQASVGGAP